MAPPRISPTIHICRPCLRLLTSNPPSLSSSILLRTFSTTPSRRKHGPVPTFTPTPSAPLNHLLNHLRTAVFLPSHLITPQRTLLYRQKNRDLLLNPDEPATVKLGSEIHTLKPLRHVDEPGTQQSFDRAVKMMGECREWGNLVPLLEGLRVAGRKVRGRWMERAVRCALRQGGGGSVMEALKRCEATGMSVWTCERQGVGREVLWGAVIQKIVEGDREGAKRWAEMLWEMCWDPRHIEIGGEDPRRMPDFLGGVMVVYALAGDAGKVEGLAREVVRWWDGRKCEVPSGEGMGRGKVVLAEANRMLMMWAPALAGMRVGRKVLGEGSEVGKAMGGLMKAVEVVVEECLVIVRGEEGGVKAKRRGVVMFEEMAKIE